MALVYILPKDKMFVGKLQLRVKQIVQDARKLDPSFPANPSIGGCSGDYGWVAHNRNSVRDALHAATKNYSDVYSVDIMVRD